MQLSQKFKRLVQNGSVITRVVLYSWKRKLIYIPAIQQSGSINCNKTSIASTRIFLKDLLSYQRNLTCSITKSVGSRKSSGSNSTTSYKYNTTSKRVSPWKPSTKSNSTKPLIVYAVRSTLCYNLSAWLPPYSNVVLRYRWSNSTVGIPLRLTLSTTRVPLCVMIMKTLAKTDTTGKLPIILVVLEVVSWILLKSNAKKSVSSTLCTKTPTTWESWQIERTLSILTYIALLTVLILLQRMLLRITIQNARYLVYSRPYQVALQLYSRPTSLLLNATCSFIKQVLNISYKNYVHASIPMQIQLPVASIIVQSP